MFQPGEKKYDQILQIFHWKRGKKVKKQWLKAAAYLLQAGLEELQLATCVFAIEPKININQGVYGGKKIQKLWNDIFPLEIAIPNVFNKKTYSHLILAPWSSISLRIFSGLHLWGHSTLLDGSLILILSENSLTIPLFELR